jgi:predicted metal-dependent hydrolase
VTITIATRRVDLDEAFDTVPKHFAADGDLLSSHLIAALSAVFPDGEDFFVRSVRHFRSDIADPVLKRQVAGFIGQEAMHGREHRAFNNRLARLGYPTKHVERLVKALLHWHTRFLPARHSLAATAALEHFTAALAEFLLTNETARADFGDSVVRDLFVWHALEESEHKAVAFDVYTSVGGKEWVRVMTMNQLTVVFFTVMSGQMIASLLADPETYRRGALRSSWRRFIRSPLMSKELWKQLRDYNRKGFHPTHRDTAELVSRWEAELFGERGTLKHALT